MNKIIKFEKEFESDLAEMASLSYFYARKVINSPFPLGEPALSKDKYFGLNYAKDILKSRFKLMELTQLNYHEYLNKVMKINHE